MEPISSISEFELACIDLGAAFVVSSYDPLHLQRKGISPANGQSQASTAPTYFTLLLIFEVQNIMASSNLHLPRGTTDPSSVLFTCATITLALRTLMVYQQHKADKYQLVLANSEAIKKQRMHKRICR